MIIQYQLTIIGGPHVGWTHHGSACCVFSFGRNLKWTKGTKLSTLNRVGCWLNKDADVSLKHAEIYMERTGLYIQDFKSTNGTFVDGKRITSEKKKALEEEGEIRMGKTILHYCKHAAVENNVQEDVDDYFCPENSQERRYAAVKCCICDISIGHKSISVRKEDIILMDMIMMMI